MSLSGEILFLLVVSLAICVVRSDILINSQDNGLKEFILDGGSRDNTILSEGTLGPEDVIYLPVLVNGEPTENEVLNQYLSFRTNEGNITYILGYEVGESQGGALFILEGGVGTNYVDLLYQSVVSQGFLIMTTIYGTPSPTQGDINKSISYK